MPGPSNSNKKKKGNTKKRKSRTTRDVTPSEPASPLPQSISPPLPPLPIDSQLQKYVDLDIDDSSVLPKAPCIVDPGNGPRVRDVAAFLSTSFAASPSYDDDLCAEFAQPEVLEMLCTVLPQEMALILWYNKTRLSSRICPACQRLYCLGDLLKDHLTESRDLLNIHRSPLLPREQEISGLCSPVCFMLASYNYQQAIHSTWGRMAEELDDKTWEYLHGSGSGIEDMGLGMLLRMARLHDLGLGQLCFPDMDLESDGSSDESTLEVEEVNAISGRSKSAELVRRGRSGTIC
ncbi:hypothetical protein JAAARDRAFT_182027 [Jaapia argillacea MUCL 33604]|uniref:Uncharacterized protein n=1 Tax=Jaapia argillacea MUCL 33604 TaxID=933084 RepID=A0A067PID8_9AGAM|nr:hypothetical protein JAAARDRAFT_182027 [Jaapia argillacea MUCL 33604]